jgi:actin-related protein
MRHISKSRQRQDFSHQAALNPRANREKIVETMFERFGFEAVNISVQAVLALNSQGLAPQSPRAKVSRPPRGALSTVRPRSLQRLGIPLQEGLAVAARLRDSPRRRRVNDVLSLALSPRLPKCPG